VLSLLGSPVPFLGLGSFIRTHASEEPLHPFSTGLHYRRVGERTGRSSDLGDLLPETVLFWCGFHVRDVPIRLRSDADRRCRDRERDCRHSE
jgi:hypothetical protein